MFYLFNKIHLKPDAVYARVNDRIVLTETLDTTDQDEAMKTFLGIVFGKEVLLGNSYQDMLDRAANNLNGSEDAFLQFLLKYPNDRRLEIHMNNADMLHFLIKWYKTILVNMTVDSAYAFFKLCYRRIEALYGVPYNSQVKLTPRDNEVCRAFAQSLPSYHYFRLQWEATPVFTIDDETRNWLIFNTALEFQLATYLSAQNTSIKAALTERIRQMVQKAQIKDLCDVREYLLQNLTNLPGFVVGQDDIAGWCAKNPAYLFLIDSTFRPDNYQDILAHYNVADLQTVYASVVRQHLGDVGTTYVEDTHFLDLRFSIEDLLTIELKSPLHREIIGRWEYGLVVNTYLIDIVLNAYRDQKLETLKPYSLA